MEDIFACCLVFNCLWITKMVIFNYFDKICYPQKFALDVIMKFILVTNFRQGMEMHRSRGIGEWVHRGCEGGDGTVDGSYAVAVKCHHFDPG